MKIIIYISFLTLLLLSNFAIAQNITQTVRGIVIDNDSKRPITGVTILVIGTNPQIGTATDADGGFKLQSIPIGRINLQASFIGYEPQSIFNIEVSTGKESILEFSMHESMVKLNEIIVNSNPNKGVSTNEMALVSSRSISTEETRRFTGAFNDPSRVIANFAGVQNSPDGNSDVIVRGNSPKYVQWRLEGVEITSPYHFDDQNASAGGLSMINNNLLATSNFYTGAFAPEFGDVLSSIYDVKFRSGNNEKTESSIGIGIIGSDITLEGPIKKGYAGSYLLNYRYNTISLIQNLGLIKIPGITNFQDAAFNIKLPTKKIGTFSIFGMGGLDDFKLEKVTPQMWATPGNKTLESNNSQDFLKKANILNIGLKHTLSLSEHSYLKTSLAFSSNIIEDDIEDYQNFKINNSAGVFLRDSIANKHDSFISNLYRSAYRGALTYSNKINSVNKIEIGTKYTLFGYDYDQNMYQAVTKNLFQVVKMKQNIATIRNFVSWKWMVNDKLTIVSGIHNMNVLFNHKSTIEPRIALNWNLNQTSSMNLGYGSHSTLESIPNYFARIENTNGKISEPNKNLDLLKANHYIIGYEKHFTKNIRAKLDFYYQDLYNLPVENNDTSYYATINEGIDYKYVELVNKGTGKNYGIELTVERFFENNYYFLITTSLYNSTYKTLEGIERNTRYNNKYILNFLAGKEFTKMGKKQNKTLAINAKLFFRGGQPYIPLLRDKDGLLAVDKKNNRYWDYKQAYQKQMDAIYQVNLSVSYKIFNAKRTHEIYLDLQNITDNQGKLYEYYDANESGSIAYNKQLFFFPNLMYKLYF